jgi:hypothetical protein
LLEEKLGKFASLVTRYLKKPSLKQNKMTITHAASAAIRYNISNVGAAAIITGIIKDFIAAGYLSPDMSYLSVDPNKMRRAKNNVMKENTIIEANKCSNENIIGIAYDGRKDWTKTLIPDKYGKLHPRVIKEEHISVSWEPTGRYLAHITPKPALHPEKPAKKIAEALYDVLEKNNATESCIVIGGDSTNINTGWSGGIHAHLEKMLGHKCYWAICMKHTNELKLRHLIISLDGPTSSKDGFTGSVCKNLKYVNDMTINYNFTPLPDGEELPKLDEKDIKSLSTDAYISYRYVNAIKSGKLSPDLANLKCGSLSHSRWLTTGMALMFLWTRNHNLKYSELEILKILVQFCVKMYFKLYFEISSKHLLEDGPRHILLELKILKTMPVNVANIITPYIRTGAWYSHSECILVSLLTSSNKNERKFGVDKVLQIRGNNELGDTAVRKRISPKINLDATILQELISWNVKDCYEPIFTCNLSKVEVSKFIENPLKIPKFSIHTQATERCVKSVTEASAIVYGQERRDGFVRTRMIHREEIPTFKSKKDVLEII